MPEPLANPHVALNNARNMPRGCELTRTFRDFFVHSFRSIGRDDIADSLTYEARGPEITVGFLKCRKTFHSLADSFKFLEKVVKYKSPKSYCQTCKRPL